MPSSSTHTDKTEGSQQSFSMDGIKAAINSTIGAANAASREVHVNLPSIHDIAESVSSWIDAAQSGKLDRRSRRTRGRLVTALISLLHEKPINDITVTELTELADVNRATFYSHYRDVHDIMNQLKADVCALVRKSVSSHLDDIRNDNYRPLIADVVNLINHSADELTVVMGPNGDGTFFNDVVEVLRDSCFEAITTAKPEILRSLTEFPNLCNYHFNFIAGGVCSVLESWVDSGRQESSEVIIDILDAYVRAVPLSMLRDNIEIAKKECETGPGSANSPAARADATNAEVARA